MIIEDQSEVISFLSRPDIYGTMVHDVQRVDTHISVIFLAGDLAYKLKRAVRFPYLDFGDLEARRHFCHAEVRVNRRTAPDIYQRAVPVTRSESGDLELGGRGEPVDWLVEMVRFDEDTLFDRLAQWGRLDRFAMEDVADTVFAFHRSAEPCPERGGRAAIADVIEGNASSFAELSEGAVDEERVAELTSLSQQILAGIGDTLDARRDTGRVRHCHGDLHLRNIFLHNGQATLFDAIEFNPELSEIDVLYDLAFLVMDLEHRNLRLLASILLNRYLDATGDAAGLAAMPLFLSLRAAIRAHVNATAARSQTNPSEAEILRAEARRYLDSAFDYLHQPAPRLIAVGGVSGSGKSRTARNLAPRLGAAPGARVVRTDATRKRLAGVPLGAPLGPQGYDKAMTERTYAAVYDECRQVLLGGQTVIADAVFMEPEERRAIEAVAREVGVPFDGLWLKAPPEVMEQRVTQRQRNVSDATAWVVRFQLQHDAGEIGWPEIDTSPPGEEVLETVLEVLALADSAEGRRA